MSFDRKGIALILTLWVMALLSVLAMSFAFYTHEENMSTRNFRDETTSYYAALSAYEDVMRYLVTDKDLQVDLLDDKGNLITDKERPSISGRKTINGIDVDVKLSDEESRLNINFLPPDTIKKVFLWAGAPEEDLTTISDSILDWKSPNELHRLNGAKSDYYMSLDPPYKAKDDLFSVPEELMLVKGIKGDYLYRKNSGVPLISLLTTYGTGINVNTVSKGVLEMLGVNPLDIERLMIERRDFGGLRAIPPAVALAGASLTSSLHFRVEISARPAGQKEDAVKLTSIVQRLPNAGKGFRIKTLYWKESV
ncbi:MAG: type II secretion system protein GspK [Nitrospiraceae bacterium]|nr:type II secretion system protein GspK [Nitrospiraceae bacterium]